MREHQSNVIRHLSNVLLLLFLGLSFFSFSVPVSAQGGEEIQKVQVKGLKLYDPGRIKARLKTKKGKTFSEDVLKQDIRRLYDTGYFNNISWHTESVAGGVKVVVKIVEENPLIEKIELNGIDEFSEESIKGDMRLQTYQTMEPHLLEKDKQMIRDRYKEEGYHFARVQHELKEGEKGQILQFNVVEGPEVSVERIIIHGAEQFEAADIKDVMKSEPGWLFGSTQYRKDQLELDLQRIRLFYRGKGYLDVKVNLAHVNFSDDKTAVELEIEIEEGEQYRIQNIRFEGNSVFPDQKLRNAVYLEPGDPFKLSEMKNEVQGLKDLYGGAAYINTGVDWRYTLAEEGPKVNVIYDISEQDKTIAGAVKIKGNSKTKDKVIRRKISVLPNQPLDRNKLQQSLSNLRSTQYFEEVNVKLKDAANNRKDVVFNVKEASTGRISLGGAISSDFGLLGTLKVQQKNFDITRVPDSLDEVIDGTAFSGGGQQFSMTLQPGVERSTYSVSLKEPFYKDMPLGIGGRLYSIDRNRNDYEEGRTGIGLNTDYRLQQGEKQYLLSLEGVNVNISDIDSTDPQELQDIEGSNTIFSLTPGISIDRRDSRIRPSQGYFWKTTLQTSVGGFNYLKLYTDYRKYFTLHESSEGGEHILSARGRLGLAEGFGNDVPTFDRFFAGGTSTIRGFEYREASPTVGDVNIGGEMMWLTNLEYTLPLIRDRQRGKSTDVLRGALFTDLGEVSEDMGGFGSTLRWSVGAGIRFKIPGMGAAPVSLDFAFPILEESGDETQVIHFDVGASF